ncbi:MAG: AAA family ATPase, partial [Pirellulaceae bacterium]|nr:AAA family ATPase [Pirellulaceae bacterium]
MITAIEIENFKGFESRQRIEFAPITMLFGANGSGKSTIAHALMLFYQVLFERDLALDGLKITNNSVRLGGKNRPAHSRDSSIPIRIRVEFFVDAGRSQLVMEESGSQWIELEIVTHEPVLFINSIRIPIERIATLKSMALPQNLWGKINYLSLRIENRSFNGCPFRIGFL